MLVRLLILPLFIFSATAIAELKLDPQLIRRWSHSLDKENPGEQPFIAQFKKGEYELFYLAATHETNLKSPTLRLIENLFKHEMDVLLVEPFPKSEGQSPSWALREAVKGVQKTNFILGGESALAVIRANARKIPFFGGEPDHRQIFEALKALGYSNLDVIGFYFVRQIPQWVRERQEKRGLLERNYAPFVKTYCLKFPVSPCPPLAEVKSWYRSKMNRELSADIVNNDVAPFSDGNLYTQKLASAVSDVRDRFTLGVIEELLKKYHRVGVVYGNGHYVTLKNSLEAALGPATLERD